MTIEVHGSNAFSVTSPEEMYIARWLGKRKGTGVNFSNISDISAGYDPNGLTAEQFVDFTGVMAGKLPGIDHDQWDEAVLNAYTSYRETNGWPDENR